MTACLWPFAEIHEVLMPTGVQPIRPLDAREGRRLAETVRSLAADRDRLLARIATLEQSLDGITGSIARVEKAARTTSPGSPNAPAPSVSPALSAAPAEPPPTRSAPDVDVTSSIPMPPQQPAEQRRQNRVRPRPRQRHHRRGVAHSLDRGAPPARPPARRPAACRTDARTAPPRRHGIAPHRRARPQRGGGGPALRQHDGGGRDLRARGVRGTASRRPLIAPA